LEKKRKIGKRKTERIEIRKEEQENFKRRDARGSASSEKKR